MKIIINIPNSLSVLRIIATPFFVYFLIQPVAWMKVLSLVIFAVASLSDFVDGYWARKYQQETDLGRFLDPLADKAIVIGSLLAFLSITEQVQLWMILCIFARDFLITVLRFIAIQRKQFLHVSTFGKIKTAFQMFSIAIVFLGFLMLSYNEKAEINTMYKSAKENYGLSTFNIATENLLRFINEPVPNIFFALASFMPYFLILMISVLTLISGLRYLITNYKLLLPLSKK